MCVKRPYRVIWPIFNTFLGVCFQRLKTHPGGNMGIIDRLKEFSSDINTAGGEFLQSLYEGLTTGDVSFCRPDTYEEYSDDND